MLTKISTFLKKPAFKLYSQVNTTSLKLLIGNILCFFYLLSVSVSCSVTSDSLQPHGLQSPLSMGFSRQEYWSRLPFPSPGDLPNPGSEPQSPALQANSLPFELQGRPFLLLG